MTLQTKAQKLRQFITMILAINPAISIGEAGQLWSIYND